MSIIYNASTNEIKLSINEIEIFKLFSKTFENSKIGFFSLDNGTIFTQLLIE